MLSLLKKKTEISYSINIKGGESLAVKIKYRSAAVMWEKWLDTKIVKKKGSFFYAVIGSKTIQVG